MAQNTNFKGNKNNNQKRKLPYIKARIDKLVDVEDCNTKAFASVTVGGAVAIHGIRVMNSRKGLFVAMPASNYVDENGETKFSEIAHPISKKPEIYSTARLWKRIIRHLMNNRVKMKPRICQRMNLKVLHRVCKSG